MGVEDAGTGHFTHSISLRNGWVIQKQYEQSLHSTHKPSPGHPSASLTE